MQRIPLTDLFHRGAELLAPLSQRLLELVAARPVVQGDETVIVYLGALPQDFDGIRVLPLDVALEAVFG